MNFDVSPNEIKNQLLPFSHTVLRCPKFKRMHEQLQGVSGNTLSTNYPQRLNMQSFFAKYIPPPLSKTDIHFCKPINKGVGDENGCM